MAYVYQEYPKCLYSGSGTSLVVTSPAEEAAALEDGWMLAPEPEPEPEPTPLPAPPDSERPDREPDDDKPRRRGRKDLSDA